MSPVDRNILRLAVFEMRNEVDVPKLVIVDEAIELAKKYRLGELQGDSSTVCSTGFSNATSSLVF